jgi:hypothetical protein
VIRYWKDGSFKSRRECDSSSSLAKALPDRFRQIPAFEAAEDVSGSIDDLDSLADYLLELKLCLEAVEEYFLHTSNPNFERRQIEKNELLRKVTFTDWPLDEREARHWRAVADDLSSE